MRVLFVGLVFSILRKWFFCLVLLRVLNRWVRKRVNYRFLFLAYEDVYVSVLNRTLGLM